MKLNNFIYLLVLSVFPLHLSAQDRETIFVCQFVKNSFTGYGVRNAFVTVMDSTDNVIDTLRTERGSGSHDAQMWGLSVPRRKGTFRVRVEHPDYETGEMTLELNHPARLNSYRFPDMMLKRKLEAAEVDLEGVTVKATRVKLCYKGDTIEVDARAFKLTEGSMLESLGKNIPGCELRDNGDIYMNGRKVDYLTLNGKEFFKGNNRIMLDNLPYYTVDKLQFYNQQSERSRLIGKDVERPDYVMNVKLKQEYNIGYLGNVEGGLGTHDRWLGRGFALRFTDNSRISLFGNANNTNDTRQPGGDGNWGQDSSPVGDTKTYNVGGEWLIDDKRGRYKEVLNATALWTKARNEGHSASQQFIYEGDRFNYGNSVATDRDFSVNASNNLTLKRIGLVSYSHFDYAKNDNDNLSRSAQFSDKPQGAVEQVIDSIFGTVQSSKLLGIMINNVRDAASRNGHRWTAEQKFDYHKSLPWGDDLSLSARGVWNGSHDDGNSHYRLWYGGNEDNRERLTKGTAHGYNMQFGANYAIHLLSGWHINIGMAHEQRYNNSKNDLYRLDWAEDYDPATTLVSMTDYYRLRDAANSPHSTTMQREEHFNASLHRHDYKPKEGRYFSFTSALSARYAWQDGTFSRGDAVAKPSDHRWLLKPSVNVEYQTRHWHDGYNFHYDTEMRAPNLSQLADLTDTSNPLAIRMGNSGLRPTTSHNLSFTFYTRFGNHGQFLMLRSSASILRNLVAMNSIYNQQSGAYTYIPVNVNGNWNSNYNLQMRRALTNDQKLNIESETSYNFIRNVDMKDDMRSIVRQHIVGEKLKLEYKHEQFTVALLSGISWHGVRLADVDNINNVNFNYGANLQTNLPWKMHLSTDIRMYSRRGYTDASMNTNNLLWNAQVDRSFFHGRLLIAARAFDLLHKISSTVTTVNAQARTETWQLSLPNYLMFTAQLKFNKNPKKK